MEIFEGKQYNKALILVSLDLRNIGFKETLEDHIGHTELFFNFY